MKKNLLYGFSGPSNSGKTTLIKRLIENLKDDHIVVLKHDPKAKAQVDTRGKDSDILYRAGADVVIYSPKETTFRLHGALDIQDIVRQIGEVDYLFIEGLKELPIPKMAIMRDNIDSSYFAYIHAIATDLCCDSLDLPDSLTLLSLHDIDALMEHIDGYGMRIEDFLKR